MTIILADGTSITVTEVEEWFGNAYNASEDVSALLTDENLSDVTIDGVAKGRMALDFVSPEGTQFYLRDLTPEESAIAEVQAQVQEVVAEPTYVHVRASQEATIAAKSRVNVQIPLTVPEGYSFGAYRGLSMAGGWEHCFFQFFDSADGGTKANIGVYNSSDTEVTVTVSCTILLMRDLQQVTIVGGGAAMEEGEEF